MVPPCSTFQNSAIVRLIQIIVDIFGWKLQVTTEKSHSLIMAHSQILQRDLFVRRLSIYQVRISRWISRWIWSSDFGVTPCKGIQDGLGFWIPRRGFSDSRYWILHFFKIGTWISGSNCLWDSGFQRPGFRFPQANLFQIPDSSSKIFHPCMGWLE